MQNPLLKLTLPARKLGSFDGELSASKDTIRKTFLCKEASSIRQHSHFVSRSCLYCIKVTQASRGRVKRAWYKSVPLPELAILQPPRRMNTRLKLNFHQLGPHPQSRVESISFLSFHGIVNQLRTQRDPDPRAVSPKVENPQLFEPTHLVEVFRKIWLPVQDSGQLY